MAELSGPCRVRVSARLSHIRFARQRPDALYVPNSSRPWRRWQVRNVRQAVLRTAHVVGRALGRI